MFLPFRASELSQRSAQQLGPAGLGDQILRQRAQHQAREALGLLGAIGVTGLLSVPSLLTEVPEQTRGCGRRANRNWAFPLS